MSSPPIRVTVFGKTDLGRTRDHNEDTFLVADLTTGAASLQPEVRQHRVGERGSLFVVADGMGGAAAGEIASEMAAQQIYDYLRETWAADRDRGDEQFATRLKEAVEHANAAIYRYAQEHPDVRGMGTTVTAAGLLEGRLFLTQIGDSRGYLVRNGQASQLTRDQSLMQRLVDAGELTEEEAEKSERRNIILQALGPDPRIKVDLSAQPLRRGDTLVLCSDGLSGLVRKDEIGQAVAEHADLPELCAALVDLANSRGGHDNITVVAARFDGDGLPEAEAADGVGYAPFRLATEVPETPVTPQPAVAAPAEPAAVAEPPAMRASTTALIAAVAAIAAFVLYYLLRR